MTTVWEPSPQWRTTTQIGAFSTWLEETRGVSVGRYQDLWRWSVDEIGDFWTAIWDYFGIRSATERGPALAADIMPGARWFPGARVNYARHLLEDADSARVHDNDIAIIAHSQTRDQITLTFAELRAEVARVRAGLHGLGVGTGDRVVAYLPNLPETIVAYLATVSLGAIWASVAPEFGTRSVVDRFAQVDPTVLLGVSGYTYGDKRVERHAEFAEIVRSLPTLKHVVHVSYGEFDVPIAGSIPWRVLGDASGEPEYTDVAFDHPLCILFSSGTTGLPKAITHGHGGILLEHLKNHALSWDLGPGDRMLWYSTTAWMMWNALVSALLRRCAIVLLDGNPMFPSPGFQWELAAQTRSTVLGLSPGFIMATRKADQHPAAEYDLSHVRQIGAAGSPLPAEGYQWVAEEFPGVLLNVGSGGTDVCTGIVQGSPLQSVTAGQISGPCLGVAAYAFDDDGHQMVGGLGELVITRPMPSMPVGFWGDDGTRYRDAYFDQFPGVWRHGDWVRFSADQTCVIAGRSDATLNRGGVRLGTAEFYRVVEELDEVEDSLVIHLEDPAGGMGRLLLFLVPRVGEVTEELRGVVVDAIRTALSPRHVPDALIGVRAIPRNRTGKKLELPVKRLIQGRPIEEVAAPGSLADDSALDDFLAFAEGTAHV